MMRTTIATVALTVILAGPALANPVGRDPTLAPKGDYGLDKRHASLIVKIPHMGGFSKFTMRFDRMDGGFTLDPANWATTPATLTIDAASIDTGLPEFDKTIAGPAYFNAAKYPTISFTARKAEAVDGQGTLTGDLT
ncbi:YceI family protein, partial [Phenylobacterium aquaticum]